MAARKAQVFKLVRIQNSPNGLFMGCTEGNLGAKSIKLGEAFRRW